MLESLSGNRNGFVNRRESFVGSSPTSSSILSCINVFTTPNKNEKVPLRMDLKICGEDSQCGQMAHNHP